MLQTTGQIIVLLNLGIEWDIETRGSLRGRYSIGRGRIVIELCPLSMYTGAKPPIYGGS